MPSNFGLTMAPETAYVTGGSVVYGSIWGSYLPIIKKYADNGRLWWLNMQYYNGSMYGCAGDSYPAGTVQGFTVQTQCLNNGLTIQGTTIRVPYDKQVPGLPAQTGAGGGYMSPSLVSPGLELRARPEGPDDLVGELGRVEGLDLRRQREAPAGPLTGDGAGPTASRSFRRAVAPGASHG